MDHESPLGQSPELRSLLDAIDKKQFTSLSAGLGLGTTRALSAPKTPSPHFPSSHHATPPTPAAVQPPARIAAGYGGGSANRSAAYSSTSSAQSSPHSSVTAGRAAAHTPTSNAGFARTSTEAARHRPTARPGSFSVLRRLAAWSLDFLLVLASLAVAFTLVILLTRWRGGPGGDAAQQRAVAWVLATNPLVTIAAVYGVLLVYGVVFKLIVGRTCGESLVGIAPKKTRRLAS